MIDPLVSACHVGDCRELLAQMPEQSVQCCVTSPPYLRTDAIQFVRSVGESLHVDGEFIRATSGPNVAPSIRDSLAFAGVFDSAKREAVLSLSFLDAQELGDELKAARRLRVGHRPLIERTPAASGRLSESTRTPEERRQEVDRLRLDLSNTDSLAVRRLTAVTVAHGVRALLDSDRSICVDDSSAVRELCFGHASNHTVAI